MKAYWALLAALLSACDDTNDGKMSVTTESIVIQMQLEEPIDSFIGRSNIEFMPDCLDAVGKCWYEFDRSSSDPNLPTVIINHNGKSLTIDQVSGITTITNDEFRNYIQNINLTLRGLPDDSTHEENRVFIYKLIEKLKAAGWERRIYPSDPRIPGTETGKIGSPSTALGIYVLSHPWFDPSYMLDARRWLEVKEFYDWYLHNDSAYMHLKVWRKDSPSAPEERGTYLIKLAVQTDTEYWLYSFDKKEEQAQWAVLLPKRLENYHKVRTESEDKLRAAGILIDESYQDPPIKKLAN